MDTRYLSTETQGGFTGTYLGLFAEGGDGGDTAWFDFLHYTPVKY